MIHELAKLLKFIYDRDTEGVLIGSCGVEAVIHGSVGKGISRPKKNGGLGVMHLKVLI